MSPESTTDNSDNVKIVMPSVHPIVCLGTRSDKFKVRCIQFLGFKLLTQYNTHIHWKNNDDGMIDIFNENNSSYIRIDKQNTKDTYRQCWSPSFVDTNSVDDDKFMSILFSVFTENYEDTTESDLEKNIKKTIDIY